MVRCSHAGAVRAVKRSARDLLFARGVERQGVHQLDEAIATALSPLIGPARRRGVAIETHLASNLPLSCEPFALQLGVAALTWDCLERSSIGDIVLAWSRREEGQAVVSIVAHGGPRSFVDADAEAPHLRASLWLAMVRRAAEELGGHVSIDLCHRCAAAVHVHLPLRRAATAK